MKATKGNDLLLKAAVLIAFAGLAACAPKNQEAEIYQSSDASESSIVGGEAVDAKDPLLKTTVGIALKGHGVICTGTLISKNLVVTAAHCTMDLSKPSDLSVTFGNDTKAKTLQTRKVLGGRVPAKWPLLGASQKKDWNDIAVLKIDGVAPAGFEPAVLLANKLALKDGQDVTIAGFGLLNMIPEKSSNLMQKVVIKMTDSKYADSEVLFAQHEGKGACHGDSGGPALITVKGRPVLIGVTSRAATLKGGMNCMEGSIYTSIAAHIGFLKQASRELNAKTFVPDEPIPQPL